MILPGEEIVLNAEGPVHQPGLNETTDAAGPSGNFSNTKAMTASDDKNISSQDSHSLT